MDNIIELFHGSEYIIKKPQYGLGKIHNDYGRAFYCTESRELSCEWAVEPDRDGFSNHYYLDMSGLNVLNLNSDKYTILHWLTVLLSNRTFDIQSDFGEEAKRYLLDNYYVDIEGQDIIRGFRADDSYFSFAQDFLNNVISIRTLSKALHFGQLGEQIALKSLAAFERLEFIDFCEAKSNIWLPQKEKRDKNARSEYRNIRNQRWQRGEIYMMQILDMEMKPDDESLRPKFD